MSCGYTTRENWPGAGSVCGCARCQGRAIDSLARRSLSAALATAQNNAEGGGWGDELTIDKDVSVIWGPRTNLQAWLTTPAVRPGDGDPKAPGQWLYRIFLGDDVRPLYIGRVTQDRSLYRRIQDHTKGGQPIAGLTAATLVRTVAANKRLRRLGTGGVNESRMIKDIIRTLTPAAFQVSVAEVKRISLSTGKLIPARASDTAVAEKHYHRKGAALINSPDNDRAEAERALSRLVNRVTLHATRSNSDWRMR